MHISVRDGALWDAWQVRCGMGEIGLSLLLFNRSVQSVVCYYDVEICFMLYLYVYVFMLYLCHVTIMKCIFVWTQVVNKLLLLGKQAA